MTARVFSNLVLMGLFILIAGAVTGAEESTWVSADGERHRLHHADGHNVFFHEGGNEIDLQDLSDGETRVFGEGVKQLSATREGDEVRLSRPAHGEKPALEVTCRLTSDSCKVVTFDDDAEKVMVVIEKTRECVNGVGDCDDIEVEHFGAHGAHTQIMINKIADCDEGEDCKEIEVISQPGGVATVEIRGDPHVTADEMIFVHGGVGQAGILELLSSDKVALRCSEGDTVMHVDKEEAGDVFLCPKHSTPLERMSGKHMIRKIKIDKSDD